MSLDRLDPADDLYLDDERETERPEVFASTLADVQAGRRFVGGLYREDPDAPDAPDDVLEWLHDFTEEAPGSRSDVLELFGNGTYRVRTFAEAPATVGRRLVLRVGRQSTRTVPRPGTGGLQTAPELPAADLSAIREEAERKARTSIQWEKDDLERQVSRVTREKGDTLESLDRAKATLAQAQSDALTLSQRLATSQDEATAARRELAELSLTHARTISELRSAHSDDLDELRAEVQESRADARIRDYELTMAQNGEKMPTESLLSVLREVGGPAVKEIVGLIAARQTAAQTPTAASAALLPAPMPPAPSVSVPPAHRAFEVEPADYASDGHAGDGHAATLDPPVLRGDVRTAPVRTEAAPAAVAEALGVLAGLAKAVVQGRDLEMAPADVMRLVSAAQASGVTAADFRDLAATILDDAIDVRTSPAALAAFLAPLAQPFADRLRPALAMPAKWAVGLVASELGIDVPEDAAGYVAKILTALKAHF